MAEAVERPFDPFDELESCVAILKEKEINPEYEISQIKELLEGEEESTSLQDVFKDLCTAVTFIQSEATKDKIIAVVRIAALFTPFFSSLLGPLSPIAAISVPVLGLLSKFLRYMWKKSKDISKLLAEDLDLGELSDEIEGIEEKFTTADNYLSPLMDNSNITEHDVTRMFSSVKIQKGVKILGILKKKIELSLTKRNRLEAYKAVRYTVYYVRISALRYAMLGQMYSIVTSALGKSATSDFIKNVIKGQDKKNIEFLQFLTRPTIKYAMFFSVFDLSDYEEIDIFMKSKGLEMQNLNEYLSGNIMHIHTGYSIFSAIHLKLAWNPWGNIWGCRSPNYQEDPPLFCFRKISETDNFFLISNLCERYMYMKENRYCEATYEKPNEDREEGIWKVIRLEDGRFLLCTKKERGVFLYMERGLLLKVKGLDLRRDITERILWKIENMKNFDYVRVTLYRGFTKFKMARPTESPEGSVSKIGKLKQYDPKEEERTSLWDPFY